MVRVHTKIDWNDRKSQQHDTIANEAITLMACNKAPAGDLN